MKILSILSILLISQLVLAQTEIEKAIADAKKTSAETPMQSKPADKPAVIPAPVNNSPMVEKKLDDSKQPTAGDQKINQLSRKESEILKRRKSRSSNGSSDSMPPSKEADADFLIYNPAYPKYKKTPIQNEESVRNSYVLERDSQLVITQYVSYKDALNVQMCFLNGLTLTFDDSIDTTIQTAIVDNSEFVGAVVADNKRGVYVHLKNQIPAGGHLESAIRLVRKSDDKTYLINLVALPCPQNELVPYPKVIYLKDKDSQPQIYKKNNVLTPQDFVISKSMGYPRLNKKRINIYDMVASSGSDWVVFGIEVQIPDNTKEKLDLSKFKMMFLDNLQINEIQSKVEYLAIPSEKITQMRGVTTFRFKASVQINKNYIMNDRMLHFMFLDTEEKHYQYLPFDVKPYFNSLINRGLDL